MNSLSELQIYFSTSPFLFWISLLILAVLTVWVYRYTLPPVSQRMRFILIVLRSLAFFCVCASIFRPVLHLVYNKAKRATLVLLIDNSASMQLRDQNKSRADQLIQMLKSRDFKILQDQYDIQSSFFSSDVDQYTHGIPDTILFDGAATDLANAFHWVNQEKAGNQYNSILLLSDGQWNRGEDPVRISQTMDLPVYTMAFGDELQKKDLIISSVQTNEVTYANDQIPIDISVRGPGFGGKEVVVSLLKDDSTYAQEFIQIPKEGLEKKVQFFYTPQKEGLHLLLVKLSEFDGEVTFANNERDVTIHALQSKWKILMLAGAPSPDLAFFKRLLEKDENVQLTVRTENRDRGFYEGNFPFQHTLDSLDLFLLFDYPSRQTPKRVWDQVSSFLLEGKPFFLIAGERLDVDRFKPLENQLPFLPAPSQENISVSPNLTPSGKIHTLTQVLDDVNINTDIWNSLPPIFYPWRLVRPKPGSQVLVEAVPELSSGVSGLKPFPLFLIQHVGQEKSAALLGSGFYRWDLMMWGIGEDNEIIKGLFSRAVRWLVTRDESNQFILKTNQLTYHSGEEVIITLQVYNDIMQPVDDADVEVIVTHEIQEMSIPLQFKDQGMYTGSFQISDQGVYNLIAHITRQNVEVGKAEAAITATDFNPEFLETRANHRLLRTIAKQTGGRFGTVDSLSSWVKEIDFPTQQVIVTDQIQLYNTLWLLVMTIILLSSEWLIRKRLGML